MALFSWWNGLTLYGGGKEERNMPQLVAFDRRGPGPIGGVISGGNR
jgi:hypothetical protein